MYDKELGLLFIHIPKTAGQSISRWMGNRIEMDWLLGAAWDYFRIHPPKGGHPNISHATAQEYLELEIVTQEEFDSAIKIAVVRNTWDRVLSEYYFKYTGSFHEYVEGSLQDQVKVVKSRVLQGQYPVNDEQLHLRSQLDFIMSKDNNVIVDEILHFENIQVEFSKFCKDYFNIDDSELPFENVKRPEKIKHYSEMYKEKEIKIVQEIYQKEIDYFGFKFKKK